MNNRPMLTSINTQENLSKRSDKIHTELLTGKVKAFDIPSKILELHSYYLKSYGMQTTNEAYSNLKEEMEAYAGFAVDFLKKLQTEITPANFLMRNSQQSFTQQDTSQTIRDTLKGVDLDSCEPVAIVKLQNIIVRALQQGAAQNPASKFYRDNLDKAAKLVYPTEEYTLPLNN